jgi:hypothetical protein
MMPGAAELSTSGLQWPAAFSAATWGAVLAACSMMVPLGTLGLGLLTGGALAVVLYQRRFPGARFTTGMGAKLGALVGALGFGLFSVLTAVELVIFRNSGEMRKALMDAVDKAAQRSADPQAQAAAAQLKSPEGLAFIMIGGMVVMFVIFLMITSLGGAVGARLTGNRKP